MYTTDDVYKMYARCLQNVSQISINFCMHFVYKIKRTMAAKICIQNVYLQKFIEMWDTFCIHLLYISNLKLAG